MGALESKLVDRPGDDEYFSTLLGGESGGADGAGLERGLDDHHGVAERGDELVAEDELVVGGLGAESKLAHEAA